MRIKTSLFVLFLMAALVWLAGCNLPTTEIPPTPTASYPVCPPDSLQTIVIDAPAMNEVTDALQPLFRWHYPEAANCYPEGYILTLRTGFDFAQGDTYTLPGNATSWTPPAPLEAARAYAWSVQPFTETESGPQAAIFYFFTGPRCTAIADLQMPILRWPAEGGLYNPQFDAGLQWEYNGPCLPQGYRIEVSADPDFPLSTTISGGTGNPSTRWAPADPLEACQRYYWRVAAVLDVVNTSQAQMTVLGPFSETQSFIADDGSGNCNANEGSSAPDRPLIRGRVWHDLCAAPDGPRPDPPPEGCIVAPDGGLQADGVMQAEEPGIAGVAVVLYDKSCSGSPLAAAITTNDGSYALQAPSYGDYCLVVSMSAQNNAEILIPGQWTYPASSDGEAHHLISLTSDETTDINFGWDYQFLPQPEGAWFQFEKNAFCRRGPSTAYPEVTAIPAGELLAIVARSPDDSWFFVDWPRFDVQCWISQVTGQVVGTLDALPIYTPMPLPTATPTAMASGPTISDVRALSGTLYYVDAGCGQTVLMVGARIQAPNGLDEGNTYLRYRFINPAGNASAWQTTGIHDSAMGGQVGFWASMLSAKNFLGTDNGQVEYQIIAQDKVGNRSSSPRYQLPLYYCCP